MPRAGVRSRLFSACPGPTLRSRLKAKGVSKYMAQRPRDFLQVLAIEGDHYVSKARLMTATKLCRFPPAQSRIQVRIVLMKGHAGFIGHRAELAADETSGRSPGHPCLAHATHLRTAAAKLSKALDRSAGP